VVLEGKEVAALRDLPCLSVPASGEAFRVIEGLATYVKEQKLSSIRDIIGIALPTRPGDDADGAPDA